MAVVQGVFKAPTSTEGKKPEEKRIEVTPGKHNYNLYIVYIAIMVVLMAGIVAAGIYFAFAGQTPVKTATDPPEVKTAEVTAENAALNAATGVVTIPENTYKVGSKIDKFPINELPKSFYIASRKMLYTNVKISSTEVSGTYTMMGSSEEIMKLGGAGGFNLYFYKTGEENTHSLVVNPKINYEAGTGTFTVKRNQESFGAYAVSISQG